MLVGYNHNFRYKGVLFHVQTEDGGIRNPQIVTHLFNGGTILISQKTSYADLLSLDNLDQVLQDKMKNQHREMLRQLKSGDFDEKIGMCLGGASVREPESAAASPLQRGSGPNPKEGPSQKKIPLDSTQPPSTASSAAPTPAAKEANLEDIILSYFIGDREN